MNGLHGHGIVVGLTEVRRGLEDQIEDVAIDEGILVVARRFAHRVGAAGRGDEGATGKVADRGDVQKVTISRRQVEGESDHLHREFGVAEAASTSRGNHRSHRHSAGDESATAAGKDSLSDFPSGAGDVGVGEVVGEDGTDIPTRLIGDIEVVVSVSVLLFSEG